MSSPPTKPPTSRKPAKSTSVVSRRAEAYLDASLVIKGEARRSTLNPSSKPVRPSRFSIELTPERRERWQKAADIAIPDRERNLAPWLVPLIDMLAEIQIAGGDPMNGLQVGST